MARQILTFVVLPNGDSGKGSLNVSIFLTPRLQNGAICRVPRLPQLDAQPPGKRPEHLT